jgi:hypothetical protein
MVTVLRAWAMARARQDRATARGKEDFPFLFGLDNSHHAARGLAFVGDSDSADPAGDHC